MNLEQFNDLGRLAVMYRTGRVNSAFIAEYFGTSRRHVQRLLQKSIPPQLRSANNRLPEEIRQYVIEQKTENTNYNCQWLSELASDHFERVVSRSTVWRVLKKEGLLHRESATPTLRHRFESAAAGDLVQMDTTWGYWLGNKRLYLTILLDDHSRYLLSARWALAETLWHNMSLIRETIENYGCFKVLYTDNASWFKVIRHGRSIYQNHHQHEFESEITRACRDLGIVHVTHQPYQPQGKGKVERIFRFIQERFVCQLDGPEIPIHAINKRFREWMDWYNTSHVNRTIGCVPKKRFKPKGFQPLSGIQSRRLDDIFCVKDTRTVDKCNQFSFEGAMYTIPGDQSFAHRTVELNIHPQRKIRVWYGGKLIAELPITQ